MSIRVLLIEDNRDDVQQIMKALHDHFPRPVRFTVVDTPEALLAALTLVAEWDLILGDVVVPGLSWSEAVKLVREKQPGAVFIAMSGHVPADQGLGIIRQGANDFIAKTAGYPNLGAVVERELRTKHNYNELREIVTEALAALEDLQRRTKPNWPV